MAAIVHDEESSVKSSIIHTQDVSEVPLVLVKHKEFSSIKYSYKVHEASLVSDRVTHVMESFLEG